MVRDLSKSFQELEDWYEELDKGFPDWYRRLRKKAREIFRRERAEGRTRWQVWTGFQSPSIFSQSFLSQRAPRDPRSPEQGAEGSG
jgi:hypothetical protein